MQVAIVGAGIGRKEGAPRGRGSSSWSFGEGDSPSSQRAKSLDRLWGWSWFSCGLSGPLASSLFVFETLGLAYSWQNFLLVLTSTYLATWVAQPIVGQRLFITCPQSHGRLAVSYSIVIAFGHSLGSGLCFPRQAG